MAHTPGPWQVGQYPWLIETEDGEEIAQVPADEGKWRGNAALISAAPDLLAALKESIQSSPYHGEPEETVFLRHACAAIAKAEGRG